MAAPKIVISHRLHDAGMAVLETAGADVAIIGSGKPEDMLPALKDADGVIIRIGSIDKGTMLQCKNLKAIGRPGVGVDDVDVAAATELGIPVVIAPGANTRSVAEHAMAMIFACAKNMLVCDHEMRKGNFGIRSEYKAYELYGKTLGLIGCGHIGKILAELATGVGMKVLVYDPFLKAETVADWGYGYRAEMEDILKEADAVSVHTPLTDATRGMIGARELQLMKKTAILVNCARGGIIDEAALVRALHEGWIQAAATDVVVQEPIRTDDPLFSCDNLIVTPHMAGQTKEAASGVATLAAEGVLAVIRGEKWDKVCNPDAYRHGRWEK
ncbi:hydroxyacid dehydrogenase [Mitsuokella sp. oral taxon 131]|uniref:hydroxyacid dehydrogenase n=1 Tax=Mitsuokella sp. oral taxon 131 TaxID=1321780 RepID=UPI0003AE1B90|nr:hydroxyacid dehydrogenase [Mitsuokella sp. oral taxon 131]ERL25402.1 4-phosphoerythronate dehydrogenase [Mitsuokella sp. oral taxon 131 str. W9106]